MYGFFTTPPGSPKSRTRRMSSLPSSHDDFKPAATYASHHRQHRPSSAFLSVTSLLALANLPDSQHSRRRVGRIGLFLVGLFVIAYVLVSQGADYRWMQSLSSVPPSGPTPITRAQLTARAMYGGDEQWNTAMAAGASPRAGSLAVGRRMLNLRARPWPSRPSAPMQNIVAARPAGASSIVLPNSAPLTPAEELAGLVHFITSNHHGVLPPAAFDDYAPATSALHADWVLDFEPGPPGPARDAVMRNFEEEVWSDARFIMFGRQRADGFLFEETVKLLHDTYRLNKAEFQMIDVEARGASLPFARHPHQGLTPTRSDLRSDDFEILEPVLKRLVPSHTLPAVYLRGTLVGSLDEVKALHEADLLKPMLDAAQLRFDKPKVKRRPARYVQRGE
jgi:hypothetical protein